MGVQPRPRTLDAESATPGYLVRVENCTFTGHSRVLQSALGLVEDSCKKLLYESYFPVYYKAGNEANILKAF